jgi:hypothetical protein
VKNKLESALGAYFWAVHNSAELDLLFFHNGKWYGIEVKFSEAPEITRSM